MTFSFSSKSDSAIVKAISRVTKTKAILIEYKKIFLKLTNFSHVYKKFKNPNS